VGGGWGGGGDETFPKFAESFAKSFANILAKFHELKISKKNTTLSIPQGLVDYRAVFALLGDKINKTRLQ